MGTPPMAGDAGMATPPETSPEPAPGGGSSDGMPQGRGDEADAGAGSQADPAPGAQADPVAQLGQPRPSGWGGQARAQSPAATLSADLGSGTSETVSLTGTRLSVDGAAVALPAQVGNRAGIQLEVVDVNKKDRGKDIVVMAPGPGEQVTWYLVHYDPRSKKLGAPAELAFTGPAQPQVKGNGRVVVSREDCGQTITTTYRLKNGQIEKPRVKKSGARDPSKCAG